MTRFLMGVAAPLLLLAGCETTKPASYTEAERSSCEKMEARMGTDTVHDHGSMKGMGMNSMNLSHERCQQILAKTK